MKAFFRLNNDWLELETKENMEKDWERNVIFQRKIYSRM